MRYDTTKRFVRHFSSFAYAANTCTRARRVIVKAEHSERGPNSRFVVTNEPGFRPREIYDGYCERGQAENFIKDFKNALAADRLSCTRFVANAFRLWLHAAAYRLLHELRSRACAIAPQRKPQFDTLRLRWLEVAATVRESVRRVLVQLPAVFPAAALFRALALGLQPWALDSS